MKSIAPRGRFLPCGNSLIRVFVNATRIFITAGTTDRLNDFEASRIADGHAVTPGVRDSQVGYVEQ